MRTIVSFMLWTVVVAGCLGGALAQDSLEAAATVTPVVKWNRTLLVIVRTKGAQPATVHPTRSFAIMHAAMYDAVNAIDRHGGEAEDVTQRFRELTQNQKEDLIRFLESL